MPIVTTRPEMPMDESSLVATPAEVQMQLILATPMEVQMIYLVE